MFLTIFHWLIVISIFLFMFNRKWLKGLWKWIFGQSGDLFEFAFRFLKKVLWFLWMVFIKIVKLVWLIILKLGKWLIFLLPRFFYWLGWVFLESFKFLFNVFRSFFEIFKP